MHDLARRRREAQLIRAARRLLIRQAIAVAFGRENDAAAREDAESYEALRVLLGLILSLRPGGEERLLGAPARRVLERRGVLDLAADPTTWSNDL